MGWTYDYVESISLSTLNHTIRYLRIHPPLELMVASYLGIKFGEDVEKQKEVSKGLMKEEFKKMNLEKTSKKIKFTNPEMLKKAKEMFSK